MQAEEDDEGRKNAEILSDIANMAHAFRQANVRIYSAHRWRGLSRRLRFHSFDSPSINHFSAIPYCSC
jgi:hypothetical protein